MKLPLFPRWAMSLSYPLVSASHTRLTRRALTLATFATCLGLSVLSTLHANLVVDGTTYTSTSGTTISTTGNGTPTSLAPYAAAAVINKGTLRNPNNWTLKTSGSFAHGVYLAGTSSFSGTNLNITTSGNASRGMDVFTRSTASLVSSTITTKGNMATVSGTSYEASAIHVGGTSAFSGSNLTLITSGTNAQGLTLRTSSSASLVDSTITTDNSGAIAVFVSGTSRFSGTNLIINTTGDAARGLNIQGSSSTSLVSSTITTGSSSAIGVLIAGTSRFNGTDLMITTSGNSAYGVAASTSGSGYLTGGTVKTNDNTTAGVYVTDSGTISAVSVVFDTQSDLVKANNTALTNPANRVTLDTVSATNGVNVFNGLGSGSNLLTVQNSKLTGNLVSNETSINTITLTNSSTLTGSSTRNATSKLNVALSTNDAQWQVAGNSTLTNLNNSGKVDMSTSDKSLRTMRLNGNFNQQASGLIAMTLSGTGGVPNALVTVEATGSTTLAGGLNLTGDLSAINNIANGYFVLFNDLIDASTRLVNGTFSTITLNGISLFSLDFAALADTGGGGTFQLGGGTYAFTYAGVAETGAYTGGNDVMITLISAPVPEPSTLAMMLGSFGMLICYLRTRRRHLCHRES